MAEILKIEKSELDIKENYVKKSITDELADFQKSVLDPENKEELSLDFDQVKKYLNSIKDLTRNEIKEKGGAWVLSVQLALKYLNYDVGVINGNYTLNDALINAVKKFQTEVGMVGPDIDGMAGPKTINAILNKLDGKTVENDLQDYELKIFELALPLKLNDKTIANLNYLKDNYITENGNFGEIFYKMRDEFVVDATNGDLTSNAGLRPDFIDKIKDKFTNDSNYNKYIKGYDFNEFVDALRQLDEQKVKLSVTPIGQDSNKVVGERLYKNTYKESIVTILDKVFGNSYYSIDFSSNPEINIQNNSDATNLKLNLNNFINKTDGSFDTVNFENKVNAWRLKINNLNNDMSLVRGKKYLLDDLKDIIKFDQKYKTAYETFFGQFKENKLLIDSDPIFTYLSDDFTTLTFDMDQKGANDSDFCKDIKFKVSEVFAENGKFNETAFKEKLAQKVKEIVETKENGYI